MTIPTHKLARDDIYTIDDTDLLTHSNYTKKYIVSAIWQKKDGGSSDRNTLLQTDDFLSALARYNKRLTDSTKLYKKKAMMKDITQ